MKILVRNSDNVVLYADDSMVLEDSVSGNGWTDNNFNSTNATIVEATLPNLWTGAVWSYANGVWEVVDTVRYSQLVEEDRLSKVPQSITKLQAMRAMKSIDLWSSFQLLISSNMDANDEWTLALDLQRTNSFVVSLAPALGLTPEQLDDLFILAGSL